MERREREDKSGKQAETRGGVVGGFGCRDERGGIVGRAVGWEHSSEGG